MEKLDNHGISLNKFISQTGICSRRAADKMIEDGIVTINDVIAIKGNRVFTGDSVKINGKPISEKSQPIYIAFNKPIGIVCTTDSSEKKNIIDFINHNDRLFPIGRLDKFSQGLIFLTNDGDIVNKILRAGNMHSKEYIVTVNKKVTSLFLNKMRKGIPILDTITKKCKVLQINENTFRIILTQGLNRQIRRMCEYLDYRVIKLNRIRIMNVSLGDLKIGQWRNLTKAEVDEMLTLVKNSSKTEEASLDKKKNIFKR